jgi:hypothetical protein
MVVEGEINILLFSIVHIRVNVHVRIYGAMVQQWTIMQEIVGSSLLLFIYISAPESQLVYCQM